MSQNETTQQVLLQFFPSCLAFTIDQYCDSICIICNNSFPKNFQCIRCEKKTTLLKCSDTIVVTKFDITWQKDINHDIWTYLNEMYPVMSTFPPYYATMNEYFLVMIDDNNVLSLSIHDRVGRYNRFVEFVQIKM